MTILLAYGGHAYADAWHDFAGVADALAHVLEAYGAVEVVDEVERALLSLQHDAPDLLVLCSGVGPDGGPSREARGTLVHYVEGGGRLLALHSAATSFPGWHDWERLLGGRWVRDVSFHPPFGPGTVDVAGAPQRSFEIEDEFYADLRVGDVEVLATHEGRPIAWAHAVSGHGVRANGSGGRVVYDALGHTAATYANAGRRALLHDELVWLGLRPRSLDAGEAAVDRVKE
ncbi:ThuA domain-containing protein [Demequina sp. NBRC 110053]|uniref:ThuA domain-containing protein n=1 Tax=Demequina sp. NBRC 110053 TaxID=1570342 RepID=UPI000A069BE9|nr:ThuA domain-containing protein [Demequina sp. NBRC 110053]